MKCWSGYCLPSLKSSWSIHCIAKLNESEQSTSLTLHLDYSNEVLEWKHSATICTTVSCNQLWVICRGEGSYGFSLHISLSSTVLFSGGGCEALKVCLPFGLSALEWLVTACQFISIFLFLLSLSYGTEYYNVSQLVCSLHLLHFNFIQLCWILGAFACSLPNFLEIFGREHSRGEET